MKITFDQTKRDATLAERGIAFEDAAVIFEGRTLDMVDDRFDYGEEWIVTVGHLDGRMMIVVWTARGGARHVISMRKANEREKKRFEQRLGKG
ncbi:BrnT family toxin [Mycetohabitans sp. B46]|uniref:BrnT family toxin n=1 Tax=Mycetohabitans sp. B46 TaxID=2772536 RepID=UPI00307E6D39